MKARSRGRQEASTGMVEALPGESLLWLRAEAAG